MLQTLLIQAVRSPRGALILASSAGVFIGCCVCGFYLNVSSLSYATILSLGLAVPLSVYVFPDNRKVLWFCLCISMPISIDVALNEVDHLGGTPGLMVSTIDMALFALYAIWIADVARGKPGPRPSLVARISMPAAALIGVSLLSMLQAPYPKLSAYEVIEVVKMYFLFLYLANNIRDDQDLKFIIHAFIALLIFEGALSYLQHRYDEPFFPSSLGGPKGIDGRVSGTWSDFNDAAWYLTFVIPLPLSMLMVLESYRQKFVYGLALVLGSAALVWSGSRAGWISFGVAAGVVGALVFSNIRRRETISKTVMVAMLVFVLACPLFPRLYTKIYERFIGEDQGSAESRIPQFEIALDIIHDHPFLGVGINNYSEIMWQYDNTEEGLDSITNFPVHNIFLHLMAETGIFGAAAFLWLVAVILIDAVDFACKQTPRLRKHVVIGLLGGIIAFLVHGMADTASIGSKLFYFLWFYAGVIYAIRRMPGSPNSGARIPEAAQGL